MPTENAGVLGIERALRRRGTRHKLPDKNNEQKKSPLRLIKGDFLSFQEIPFKTFLPGGKNLTF
jgi:hypothetical protein